jgi:UDP-N-acetylglucosamine:LPS N-acetylglucosamine transferase
MPPESSQHSKNIVIVYFDAASGHRSAAAALSKALKEKRPSDVVEMINIVDVFDHHRTFGKIIRTGIDYFNWQIKKDKVFDLVGLINLSLLCHDLVGAEGIKKISEYWSALRPDVVISVTPMYNPVLFKSAAISNPNVQCITIPVDFEEVKPRYWFTPKVQQFYLNATERLQEQAKNAGVPENMMFRINGMPADHDAYYNTLGDKNNQLLKLGLDPQQPTGFLSFGGQGTKNVLDIAKALAAQEIKANMIIMCGRNKKLFDDINRLETPYKKAVFSYLQETPINYQHLADFAIGKPGAMTITEALITRTPLIALKSKGMSPVQRGNEHWLSSTGTGIVAPKAQAVAKSVSTVLSEPTYKINIEKYFHHAIDDAINIIEQITNYNQQNTCLTPKTPLLLQDLS